MEKERNQTFFEMDSEIFWILKIQEAQYVARLTSEVGGKWSERELIFTFLVGVGQIDFRSGRKME